MLRASDTPPSHKVVLWQQDLKLSLEKVFPIKMFLKRA